MAVLAVLATLLLAASSALACDTPPGGCKDCNNPNLGWARIPANSQGLGSYFEFGYTCPASGNGFKSTKISDGNINYEYIYIKPRPGQGGLSIQENLVSDANIAAAAGPPIGSISDHATCCAKCVATATCSFYIFYPVGTPVSLTGYYPLDNTGHHNPVGAASKICQDSQLQSFTFNTEALAALPAGISTQCTLLTNAKSSKPANYAFNGDQDTADAQYNPKAIIGGQCNPECVNDPHLIGAHGTKFDFNGGLKQPYCLITDKHMHINVLLDGYVAAAPANKSDHDDAKKLRTWIKEIGLLWTHEGEQHSAHLVARRGKEQGRGSNGFLQSLTVDGKSLEVPKVGETISAGGAFKLAFTRQEKKHIFDVDRYMLSAGSSLELDVHMRVAHPNLQSEDDAQAHFSLGFLSIENSPAVHGVLGQTWRDETERIHRAARFQRVAAALNGPLLADGENGKGFLDGSTHDYVSSSILAPDCKFSAFTASAQLPKMSSE